MVSEHVMRGARKRRGNLEGEMFVNKRLRGVEDGEEDTLGLEKEE